MKRLTALLISLALTVAALAGCVPAENTTFLLANESDDEIYRSDFGWLTLTADGKAAAFDEPGCMARCGSFTGTIVCGARIAAVVEVEPGGTHEKTWDGTWYEIDQDRGCYRPRHRRADFRAEFCYGHDYESHGEEVDQDGGLITNASVDDPVCEVVGFERGEVVELVAE